MGQQQKSLSSLEQQQTSLLSLEHKLFLGITLKKTHQNYTTFKKEIVIELQKKFVGILNLEFLI